MLEPVPFVGDDFGVTAFFIRVEIVGQDNVWAYLIELKTAGRLAGTHGKEGNAAGGDKMFLRPLCAPLIAVIEGDSFVGLELRPVDAQQALGIVATVGGQKDVPLAAGER